MKYNKVSLASVCNFQPGFAFKSKDFGEYDKKVIKITNITPPSIEMENLVGVNLENYDVEKLKKFEVHSGDFVMAMTGSLGRVSRIHTGNAYINQRVLLFKPTKYIDKDFLYYSLIHPEFEKFIISHADSETCQANIGHNTVGRYQINLPNIDIQKKISKFLTLFDNKIELNKNINKNLLQQMQAIYKSLFIDGAGFSSIKQKSWTSTNIYALANIIYGAPFASKLFNTKGIGKPIIRIRDLKSQKFSTYTTEQHRKGYLLRPGDIVVGMDGEFRPYIWANDEAWLNQRVCVFDNKRPKGKAFLYFTIKPLLHAIEQTQVGTTVIHIGKKDFDKFEIIIPDNVTLDKFDEITNPMIDKIILNNFENLYLSRCRDYFVIKLISGDIEFFEHMI